MDALLSAFVAAGLAEWGDKTQLLVVALAIRYRRPAPILAAFVCFFIAEFGDKTQFLTFSIAARFESLLLAAAGATAGVLAASVPAAVLGDGLARSVPLRGIRLTAAILFLVLACIVAVNAWRLV